MKAKVKETGEIIEVVKIIEYSEIPGTSYGGDYEYYKCENNKKLYSEDELEFINIYPDWQQVRIQAAISAMNGFCASSSIKMQVSDMARLSVEQADALIKELKKEK